MMRLERIERVLAEDAAEDMNWSAVDHRWLEWALAMLREAEQEWKCEESVDTLPCSARSNPCPRCLWLAKLREEV